jgi:hypothetical protein
MPPASQNCRVADARVVNIPASRDRDTGNGRSNTTTSSLTAATSHDMLVFVLITANSCDSFWTVLAVF